jgi:hypothetical protein
MQKINKISHLQKKNQSTTHARKKMLPPPSKTVSEHSYNASFSKDSPDD